MATGDEILREGVRQNLITWVEKLECGGDVEKQNFFKKRFLTRLRSSPVATDTDTANEQHYEVPTEFFTTVLGSRLKYSSCMWPEGVETLDEAEDVALNLYCERAQIEDGQAIMDLGCGWGSFGMFVAEKYPKCRVTCISNSSTQRAYIQKQAQDRGISGRLKVITADANVFSTSDRFDRIISIEMFEHMKNYDTLFQRVSSWLKPSGLLFLQVFCHRAHPYAFDTKTGSDTEWMAKNFFTGGTMPSSDLFLFFQNDVTLKDFWCINGSHYSKTLEAWLKKMDTNMGKVQDIFDKAYGKDSKQQIFNWRLFFIFCSEVFGFNNGNEWYILHQLFRKKVTSAL
ncbi:(S)-coclaurine N-methyltransferase-like [Plakobranchus ocellatus]|uniref:(S)-coclaurine N-methyltransferase-like n=1 Tax=Plakobranchus ocellatus TaxID=259542 RepID=A0AAV3Y3Z7_9GAST|nr:(S)-coclaurine N-methyltransferase-like [Plakobranchus ocellatus]